MTAAQKRSGAFAAVCAACVLGIGAFSMPRSTGASSSPADAPPASAQASPPSTSPSPPADEAPAAASVTDADSSAALPAARTTPRWEPSHLKAEGYTARFAIVFVFLAGMLGLALWWLKRNGGRLRNMGPFHVLGRCDLGPRKSLYTVRVGTRTLVLGVTDASIHTVLELPPEEGRDVFPDPPAGAGARDFAGVFQGLLARMGGR